MELFKGRKNLVEKYNEKHFTKAIEILIENNFEKYIDGNDSMYDIFKNLYNDGIIINDFLEKNGTHAIKIFCDNFSWKIEYKDAIIEDYFNLIELLVRANKQLVKKINNLFSIHLNSAYQLIENDKKNFIIIESDGKILSSECVNNKEVKKMVLEYHHFSSSIESKKKIIGEFNKEFEKFRKKFKKLGSDNFENRLINKSFDQFFDILNNFNIRHDNDEISVKNEIKILNYALSNALFLISIIEELNE